MKNTTIKTNLRTIINNAIEESNNDLIIANIPLEYLKRATNQRLRINKNNVNKIAKNWAWNQFDLLKVTYHFDNDYVEVQDGWHRTNAAILANEEYGKEIVTLPCRVFINLSRQEELDIFLKQQDNVTRLRIVDKFPSLIEKRDKATIDFVNLCNERNIIINGYNDELVRGRRRIGSITKAKEIVEIKGRDCLSWCFDIIFDAHWDKTQGGFRGSLLKTLADFYSNDCRELIKTHIVEILKEVKTISYLNVVSGAGMRGNEAAYKDYILRRLNGEK